VRRASGDETKLFIPILDLSIKRRPTKENYFRRFLGVRRSIAGLVTSTGQCDGSRRTKRCERLLAASDGSDRISIRASSKTFASAPAKSERSAPSHIRELPACFP
jgi:hypothetical protein